MKKKNVYLITSGALIASFYVLLTLLARVFGLDSGIIQLRLSEVLTILPVFTPAAIPGLFVGCIISNLLCGAIFWDIIFGSLATLIGAIGTYLLRRHRALSPIPPILANTVIIPFVLAFAYGYEGTIPFFMLTVGVGEVLSCGVLGIIFMRAVEKIEHKIKW